MHNLPENALFEQEGVPANTSRDTRALLQELFEENSIGKHSALNWPLDHPIYTSCRNAVHYVMLSMH